MRERHRPVSLLNFYPPAPGSVESRFIPEPPKEHTPARLLVKCTHLKFELEIEPMWASMALYDLKERKKLSENFYFDMNSESLKQLVQSHQSSTEDHSTHARACIFNITYPSDDLFLVVRVEKCLQQGDIGECAEPYVKAAASGQSASQVEKLASNAAQFCERLGKYRMPFVWTAINVMTILTNGSSGASSASTSNVSSSNEKNEVTIAGCDSMTGVSGSKSSSLDRRTAPPPQSVSSNVGGKNGSNTGSSSSSSSAYGLKNAYESFRKVCIF